MVQRPFDVERSAVMGFKVNGMGAEFLQKHGRSSPRIPFAFQNGQGLFVEPVRLLRRSVTTHQLVAQARHSTDADTVPVIPGGVGGIEYAAEPGLHHGQHQDAHWGFPVVQAVMHAIGEGRSGVETGNDAPVGVRQVGNGDIENRGVLAGERDFAILADGGTADRNALPRREKAGGSLQGPVDVRGQRCCQDQFANSVTGGFQPRRIVIDQIRQQGIDLPGQPGIPEELTAGRGGHGKTPWRR